MKERKKKQRKEKKMIALSRKNRILLVGCQEITNDFHSHEDKSLLQLWKIRFKKKKKVKKKTCPLRFRN